MSEILEDVECNICESRESVQFLSMERFVYRKCTRCGLVYQNPRPVFHNLRTRYRENYFSYELQNQENFFHLMKLGLNDIRFDRFYCDSGAGRNFLDIGCATGLLLNYVKNKGWNTKGVEICRESAEYGIKRFGLDIFIGTIEEAHLPDKHFDVVHLSHLIEHVPDPKSLLFEVKRILKPGGHMVLTTPNVDGFQARVSGERWRSAIPDHIYLFAKKTMRVLLERTQFQVVKQVSWGGIPAGRGPKFLKCPADKLAKYFNIGDVMLFHCTHS
jgi:2-polyprenyl-3-methyl-5-hydroxy-6-metoxy-1,4-benzoquinol methylase